MPRCKRGPRSTAAEERRTSRRVSAGDLGVAEGQGAETRPSLELGAETRPFPDVGTVGCGDAPAVFRPRLPWGPCADPPPGWDVRLVAGIEVLVEEEEEAAAAPPLGPPVEAVDVGERARGSECARR